MTGPVTLMSMTCITPIPMLQLVELVKKSASRNLQVDWSNSLVFSQWLWPTFCEGAEM